MNNDWFDRAASEADADLYHGFITQKEHDMIMRDIREELSEQQCSCRYDPSEDF